MKTSDIFFNRYIKFKKLCNVEQNNATKFSRLAKRLGDISQKYYLMHCAACYSHPLKQA